MLGVFRRRRLLIDECEVDDPCEVLWLQTPLWFADFRYFASARPVVSSRLPAWCQREYAFAGSSVWDGERLTWTHVFDTHSTEGSDSHRVRTAGDFLYESGLTTVGDRQVSFGEEWERIAELGTDWSVHRDDSSLRIDIRDHAIAVTRYPAGTTAARYRRLADRWSKVRAIGSRPSALRS